jgi:drug/metabolite transporter (DMT)-like permease
MLLGAIQFAAFSLTYNLGLRFTEASRGALMLATMPLWSAFLARRMGSERLRPSQVLGIIVTLGGVAAAVAEHTLNVSRDKSALLGDGLMLLTAALGAMYGVLAHRVLARYRAVTVTTYAMVFGTLLLAPFCMLEHPARDVGRMGTSDILLIIFLGTFGGAIAYFLWTFGFTILAPTQVAIYVNLNPIVATIMGAALLGEMITPLFLIGFLAVFVGVSIVNWPRVSG